MPARLACAQVRDWPASRKERTTIRGRYSRRAANGYDAYEVTACWATVLANGAAHKMHQHPNNFLSGVYYVRTHPGADTINFHDPRNQSGIIRPPVVEPTAENTDQVVVRVKDGTMLVFSGLPAALRRREQERRRENQYQLQHHVFCVHEESEQAAVVSGAVRP